MPPAQVNAKWASSKAWTAYNLVTFTVGAKVGSTINVAIQFKDARGKALQRGVHGKFHLAALSTGLGLSGVPTTSALAVGTNGTILNIPVAGLMAEFVTDGSGRFDVNLIQTAAGTTYYLVLRMPDGALLISPAITF